MERKKEQQQQQQQIFTSCKACMFGTQPTLHSQER